MHKALVVITLFSCLTAGTIINLKNGASIEGSVVHVNPTVLQMSTNQGVMIKIIASIQTSDTILVNQLIACYPQIISKKISEYTYLLDLSTIERVLPAESNDDIPPFIQSYAFNFMLNTQRKHLIEINARILTRHNWCGEIGYSHGTKSFPDAINFYNQNLQIEFSTESVALGLGYRFDMKIGHVIPDINFWLSSSNASIPVKYRIAEEGDSLLLVTDVNEMVISPGLTFFKIDSNGLLQLMIGIRYFSDGILLGKRGWWLEERYYPVDKNYLKRGLSIHLGIGLNIKIR